VTIFNGDWIPFTVRCALLALLMGVLSHYEGDAYREEMRRGFYLTLVELVKF
jgi:hypothetical protein